MGDNVQSDMYISNNWDKNLEVRMLDLAGWFSWSGSEATSILPELSMAWLRRAAAGSKAADQ